MVLDSLELNGAAIQIVSLLIISYYSLNFGQEFASLSVRLPI